MEHHDDAGADSLASSRDTLVVLARMHLDRRLWGKIDPEDVVQQTLQEAWARREQFRGDSEVQRQAWLRQALLHNVLDAARHYRRQKCDAALEQAIDGSVVRLVESLAAAQSTPSQRAARNEDLAQLAAALAQLAPAQQEAVVLHHLHGLKLAEVAEYLGRSLTATAGLIHRGLSRLRALMSDGECHA
jgi:RNA polymerase sigma-70 factor, ECF subfamily